MTATVKEKRIAFRPNLVRAILDNRKTMTRRIMNPQPEGLDRLYNDTAIVAHPLFHLEYDIETGFGVEDEHGQYRFPYGRPGDRLCIISAFNVRYDEARDETHWTAEGLWVTTHGKPMRNDGTPLKCGPKPSMFMPYWLSVERWPLLEITEVRCQRIQDISEADVEAEGVTCGMANADFSPYRWKEHFASTWDNINGKGAWERNDWVWAISFRRLP